MKKLLIVSLFLLSMIGLFAQAGVPYSVIFNTHTEDGVNFHPEGTVGFKVEEYHINEMLDGMFEMVTGGPRKYLYWNWPGQEDLNTGDIVYDPTTGQLAIQMATLTNWYNNDSINARFWFIDASGNYYPVGSDVDPSLFVDIAKTGASQQTHPDPINWGGPAAPEITVNWATTPMPADGATNVALDAMLSWVAPAEGDAPTGYMLEWNGGEAMDLGNVLEYTPMGLAYSTEYTWSVTPYVDDSAKKGMKATREMVYPEGEKPVWSFTTMDEPYPGPDAWATYSSPADGATGIGINMDDVELPMPNLMWSYEGTVDPDGFEVWINEEHIDDVVYNPLNNQISFIHPVDLAYATLYTWGVKPYINTEARKGMKATREMLYPEGEMPTWTFTTMDEPVSNIIPEDDPRVTETLDPVIPDVPEEIPASLEYIAVTVNQPTAGLFGVQFTLPQAYGAMRVLVGGTQWILGGQVDGQYEIDGLDVTVWILFAGGAKEARDIVIVDDNTLPVELSSFTAVAHANEYVTLKWVAESESNLHGYNVYRAETESFEQAMRINPTVVEAQNQSVTSTYTYTDAEVETATYYYWLEVSELSNENSFHGPIVVTVEDDAVVPGITETTFRNFGPSPFTSSTSTTLRVKEGETASVTIYNLLGQVVRREFFNAGEHNFTFNGKDTNNRTVANGIYFVKMTSPSTSKSFKIVKIK